MSRYGVPRREVAPRVGAARSRPAGPLQPGDAGTSEQVTIGGAVASGNNVSQGVGAVFIQGADTAGGAGPASRVLVAVQGASAGGPDQLPRVLMTIAGADAAGIGGAAYAQAANGGAPGAGSEPLAAVPAGVAAALAAGPPAAAAVAVAAGGASAGGMAPADGAAPAATTDLFPILGVK